MGEFKKFDTDKVDYSLLQLSDLEDVVKVMQFGANKYGRDNWKECKDTNRYMAALLRHISAHQSGQKLDDESGLPHLAHAICNLMFLSYLEK